MPHYTHQQPAITHTYNHFPIITKHQRVLDDCGGVHCTDRNTHVQSEVRRYGRELGCDIKDKGPKNLQKKNSMRLMGKTMDGTRPKKPAR